MKKLLLMLVAVVMMLATVRIPSYAANTDGLVISGGKVTAKAGDTVEVPLVIEKNSGFAGLNLYFTYPSELTFVSITNSVTALTMTSDATTVWDGAANYTGTGNLAILKFAVSGNAEYKEYSVGVHFIEAFDLLGNDVTTAVSAGSIEVVCPSSDTNGNHVDADGDWESDEVYHFRTCGCGTVFDSGKHSGGSATCKEKAKCETCGQEYGSLKSHVYTAKTIKAEALKTSGNCRDEAVYYYSCAACGLVEGDANHTFKGAKVATNHAGGTTIVNKADANHKTQTNGYTGDTKCLGCGQIIAYGQTIPADSHTPATVWSTDGTYHWKECIVSGCGTMIDGTKKAHYSNKAANKATCQKAAVCDECGVTYGTVVPHDWETTYTKDATGHWYTCKTSGCTEKNGFAAHTPDHQGSATEEYAIKCTACQYEIEAQLAHTHVYDKEVVKDAYRASKATCDKAATYYKSCKCGAAHSSKTFSYGNPVGHKWDDATCTAPKTCSVCHTTEGTVLGHSEGTEWKSDRTGHWHICARTGCGAIIDSSKTAHIPDRIEPTKTDDVKCTECGYVIATLKSSSSSHHHDHGTEWLYNSDEHWHQCKCGATAFIDSHVDADKDGKCDTCGYGENDSKTVTTSAAPTTGDNSMIWLWLVFMAASAVGVVMMRVKFRKLD